MARKAGDCVPCWARRQGGQVKRTRMRIETEFFEYVDVTNRRTRWDTLDEAKADRVAHGSRGQVRRRVDFVDVLAVYVVRDPDIVEDDGTIVKQHEYGRAERAQVAGALRDKHPGSLVYMEPEDSPVTV